MENKTEVFQFRLTLSEKAKIKSLAKEQGMNITQFLFFKVGLLNNLPNLAA